MTWGDQESISLAIQAFYEYSPWVEDYAKLVKKAARRKLEEMPKLMNLAARVLREADR